MNHGGAIGTMGRRLAAAVVLGLALFAGVTDARASELPISVGEITPAGPVDAADVRAAAESELAELDPSQLRGKGKLVVALALVQAPRAEHSVKYTANAMLRDARTGTMIAIIEGGAHAEGELSAALAKEVAHSAVRSAIRRIPTALLAKK